MEPGTPPGGAARDPRGDHGNRAPIGATSVGLPGEFHSGIPPGTSSPRWESPGSREMRR